MIKALIIVFTSGFIALSVIGQITSVTKLIETDSKLWILGFFAASVTAFSSLIGGYLFYNYI